MWRDANTISAGTVGATARVSGREARVTVSALTEHECRLECPYGLLKAGSYIVLTVGDIRAIGTVATYHDGHAKVTFHNPLHVALIEHLGFPADRVIGTAERVSTCRGTEAKQRWRSRTLKCLREVAEFFA